MSSISFRLLVEDLGRLFSSRIPSLTHILAPNFLNGETMHLYFGTRGAAEARLSCFSWPWAGYSSIGVLASIARLRFTGRSRLKSLAAVNGTKYHRKVNRSHFHRSPI